MSRKKTERPRLRVHKHTLRTLSAVEAAAAGGGNPQPGNPGRGGIHAYSPRDSRYCLDVEEP
jgi:hypothetical protein